jgi:hypothetical protein
MLNLRKYMKLIKLIFQYYIRKTYLMKIELLNKNILEENEPLFYFILLLNKLPK